MANQFAYPQFEVAKKWKDDTSNTFTAAQFEANDEYHLLLIKMKVKKYIWKDTGLAYKCDNGVIKPEDVSGFMSLINIVSKDFAKKYVEMPDYIPNPFLQQMRQSNRNTAKHAFMKFCWENYCPNHKPQKAATSVASGEEKPKKVKKGKKNRGKR
jgi:hypothetical protein